MEDQNAAKDKRKKMNLIKEMLEHGQEFYLLYIPDTEKKQQPPTL